MAESNDSSSEPKPLAIATLFNKVFEKLSDPTVVAEYDLTQLEQRIQTFRPPAGLKKPYLDALASLFVVEYCFRPTVPVGRPPAVSDAWPHLEPREWLTRVMFEVQFLLNERRAEILTSVASHMRVARMLLDATPPVLLEMPDIPETLQLFTAHSISDILRLPATSMKTRFFLESERDDSTPEHMIEQTARLFQLMNASVKPFSTTYAKLDVDEQYDLEGVPGPEFQRNIVITSQNNVGVFIDLFMKCLKFADYHSNDLEVAVRVIVVAPMFDVAEMVGYAYKRFVELSAQSKKLDVT